jgi:glycosyltransferase involved in cell wall biosynthesis
LKTHDTFGRQEKTTNYHLVHGHWKRTMNWVFFDFIPWDYDVATPGVRPLGGSQSALCYLAQALARRGERVTTVTNTRSPRRLQEVDCLSLQDVPASLFAPAETIVVVLNGPAEVAASLRAVLPPGLPLVLWTQHAHDQPAMAALREAACGRQWDRIVCISRWQRQMFQQQLGVPAERIDVLRNAIGPAFERLFASREELAEAKRGPPRLVYTSTPFRGLDLLLEGVAALRGRQPPAQIEVYSSMQVYGQPSQSDPYQTLYARCQATEGMVYIGSLPQPELAARLRGAQVLAYPNTFPETSCIAVMEALAAGLAVVTSDLGALPETGAGWARLVPPLSLDRGRQQYLGDYVAVVHEVLAELAHRPAAFFDRQWAQVCDINAHCNWQVRAEQWVAAAQHWLVGRPAPQEA